MSITGSLVGYENNNDVNKGKMNKKQPIIVSSSGSVHSKPKVTAAATQTPAKKSGCGKSHFNSLWSLWYGLLATILQAYIVVQCAKRFLSYTSLPWPITSPPPRPELHAYLLLTGAAVLLLPLFLASALFKVGNLANDGFKLGRHLSTCSGDPPSVLLGSSSGRGTGVFSSLWQHGGPTAPFIHLVTAFCLLLPKLLMEARLIEAGFLPQESIWRTDLDFMVVHRDRLVVLSFMTSPSTLNSSLPTQPPSVTSSLLSSVMTTALPSSDVSRYAGLSAEHLVANSTPEPGASTPGMGFSVERALRALLGSDDIDTSDASSWGGPISVEFLNYALALLVYSVRYPAVFWHTNKAFGTVFSLQLLANSLQSLLAYAGMSVLYKVQIVGAEKALPLLMRQSSVTISGNSPFLLNSHVTLALYTLSGLLIVSSSLVLYLYGHGRFNAFLNTERERRVIILREGRSGSGWGYFTHCAALCALLAIAVCNAPLLYDYTVVYRGSLDGAILACVISGIFHLFLWVVVWLFLTIKQKWVFKLRVTIGRAAVRSARSVKLVTDVDLISSHQDEEDGTMQPLLVVGNGRTYTIADNSPKKAIMSVIQKAALDRRARAQSSGVSEMSDADGEEQIYWLRPNPPSPKSSPDSTDKLAWFNRKLTNANSAGSKGHKVTFNDLPSTSQSRNKRGILGAPLRGIGSPEAGGLTGLPDDGDYATLRELPLMSGVVGVAIHSMHHDLQDIADDSTSEEGKLLACVRDDSVTYASTNRDMLHPGGYEDPSPLLTPEPLPDPPIDPRDLMDPRDMLRDLQRDLKQVSMTPVTATIHHDTQVSTGLTPRCLRRADSGMPHDEFTPRSDSISTECSGSPPDPPDSNHSESSSGIHSNASSDPQQNGAQRRATSVDDLTLEQNQRVEEPRWRSCSLQRGTQPPTAESVQICTASTSGQSIYGYTGMLSPQYVSCTNTSSISEDSSEHGIPAVILENPIDSTVVIRRKHSQPKIKIINTPPVIDEEPFGRSTNMRMTSFTEHKDLLRNSTASSATLPNYPTQPTAPAMYPNCSTMPLPHGAHTSISNSVPSSTNNLDVGSSCHSFQRQHTTIPTHHNGVRLFAGTSNPYVKRFPTYANANIRVNACESPYGIVGGGHHSFSNQVLQPMKYSMQQYLHNKTDRDSANFSMASSGDSDMYVNVPHHS